MAAAPAPLCPLILRNGLIEILYATTPLDSDADADVNGLLDVWEELRTPDKVRMREHPPNFENKALLLPMRSRRFG